MKQTIRNITGTLIAGFALVSAAHAGTNTAQTSDFAAHLVDMRQEIAFSVEAGAVARADQISEIQADRVAKAIPGRPQYAADVEFMTAATEFSFVLAKYEFYPVTAN